MRGRSFIFFILSPKQSDLFYFLWLLWQLSILSCTAVDLQDGALLWTISSSFHHKVNISFQKKSLNALFSLTRHVKTQVIIVKNELSITRPPLDGVHLCISCGGNGCRLLWSFARHQPQIISDGGNVLVFFSQSSFCVSLDQTKVPASSPCPKQTGDSSLNLPFIQPSTVYGCFSLSHCNLVFFPLGVSDGLSSLPVSYSSLSNIDSYFYPFALHFLSCTCSIFRHIAVSFLGWRPVSFLQLLHHWHWQFLLSEACFLLMTSCSSACTLG